MRKKNSKNAATVTTTAPLTVVQNVENQRNRDCELRLHEIAAAQQLLMRTGDNRPAKTKSTWAGKQTEYFSWNVAKGYSCDLVNEGKFLLFLSEIKDRAVYKRGRKRKIEKIGSEDDEDALPEIDVANSLALAGVEEEAGSRISWSSLEGYVNAVMDIWKNQHTLGRFPPGFPHPSRPPSVSQFLKNARKDYMEEENTAFVDRGRNTLADDLNSLELSKLAKHYWDMNSETGIVHLRLST